MEVFAIPLLLEVSFIPEHFYNMTPVCPGREVACVFPLFLFLLSQFRQPAASLGCEEHM